MTARIGTGPEASVAYVLKAFPVLSETFISSEIHRVENAGVRLRIFVVKPRDDREHHPVIDRIQAEPSYLPATRRLSETSRLYWLVTHFPKFVPSLLRTFRRRPAGFLRAVRFALSESVLTRRSFWSWPKISYIRDFFLAAALADRVLRVDDVCHLHAHFAHDTTTITWLASMITGLPFSFTAHAKDIYAERLNPRDFLRRKLHAASFVVTCTESNRRHLRAIADGTPVHRVYHGLNDDFSKFLRGGDHIAPAPGGLRLLSVGRLVRKKGLDVMVEACGNLDGRGVSFQATIIGDDDDIGDGGPVSDDLRRRIARLGLGGRLQLLGQIGQEELYERYRTASVFCLPCRVMGDGDRDGIPNVLLEAMSCEVPVITTPVSGIPELVEDGTNGLLVPQDDPEALADAILRLWGDPELARRLGTAGGATVRERFDGDHLAAQLATLFDGVAT
jgi:glycosyltransferase involved in cell wall biosynthesis